MAAFFGRRGDGPPEKRSPGAGGTGAMSFGGDSSEDSPKKRGAQRQKARKLAFDAVVHDDDGERVVRVEGRVAWALRALVEAGNVGCTPITHPGPRWSDYTMKIRRAGISVETIYERHGPPFEGNHGRYVLRSKVTLREPAELREVAA